VYKTSAAIPHSRVERQAKGTRGEDKTGKRKIKIRIDKCVIGNKIKCINKLNDILRIFIATTYLRKPLAIY